MRAAQFGLAEFLRELPPRPKLVVAFSGGLDSTVLTHLLAAKRRQLGGLRLVHVDHGLQAASADWARHCARQARAMRLPIAIMRANVRVARGESLEAVARDARYAQFAKAVAPGEVLVTAQHQDDQAETLLLQLFRGAGVAGLAAMPSLAPFARGHIARPLLGFTRAELERYAKQHRLTWVEDPTNQSDRFARNFLRHRVMPLLRERWAGVDACIARSARHMAEAASLLEETARKDLLAVMDGSGLNVAGLRRLPLASRRNVLRAFIAHAGVDPPSNAQMREIAGALLVAREDAQPDVKWQGGVLARRAGRLELRVVSGGSARNPHETPLKSWRWKDQREFILNGAGDRMVLMDDPEGAIDLDKLPGVLEFRPRQGGESLRPAPKARTQSLKKLLQAARLTIEERAALPLLFGEGPKGRLIAVGDRWLDASVMANVKSRRRARLILTRS